MKHKTTENIKQPLARSIRILTAVLALLCLPMIEASANYYYKLQLLDVKTEGATPYWTGWIHMNQYNDSWYNGLRDWLENRREVRQIDIETGVEGDALPSRYTTGLGTEYLCNDADESAFEDKIKYKVVGIAFKGKEEPGNQGQWYEILDGDDYFYMDTESPYRYPEDEAHKIEVFNRIKDEVKTLDLSQWGKHFWRAEHYFGEMTAMTDLYLPDNDFAIYDQYMFANAYNLETIHWSSNSYIREVGKGAFRNCFKLSQNCIQRILNEVAEHSAEGAIGAEAFYNCLQLQDVTIPARIRWIGNEAFCQQVYVPADLPSGFDTSILKPSLQTVTFATDNTKTGSSEYWKSWYYEDPDVPSEWYGYSDSQKWEQHWTSDYTWSGLQIDNIGDKAFSDCQLLENVILGNDIQLRNFGYGVFANCRFLTSSNIQAMLDNFSVNGQDGYGNIQIPAALFWGVNGKNLDGTYVANPAFTTLTIPGNVSEIGAGAFGVWVDGTNQDHSSIKDIYVSRGWRPDCKSLSSDPGYSVDGYFENFTAFSGLVPNHVTVHFDGNAATYTSGNTTGYTTYMTDNNEFQRLLTKDIYSAASATDYDVVPQQHAIVRLHRTMKEGWNSMCLPFGATAAAKEIPVNYDDASAEGATYANTRLLQRALNANGGANFMLAAYRDYMASSNTFRFLHVTDYDAQPQSSYVPFLVYMDADDIAGDGIYTFSNVDVNYDWHPADGEENTGYTSSNVTITTDPDNMDAAPFVGKAETFAPFNDAAGTYSDYEFTGTFRTMVGTVGNGSDDINNFITTNDYYIQNNDGVTRYYQYESGKKVGIKAFTGWFHYVGSNDAKPLMVSMDVLSRVQEPEVDFPETVTSLPQIEISSLVDEPVYDLSGRRVAVSGKMISDLPKGIYVSGGRKFVVR